MPPLNRIEVERVESIINIPLTTELLEQTCENESDIYVPDDIRAVAFYGIHAAIENGTLDELPLKETKSHLRMVHNLERFILAREEGMKDSQLFEHQRDVFHDIYKFLAHPPLGEHGELERKGYIKLPTGTGKTAIFTTLVDVLNKSPDDSDPTIKTLVLVPKLDLVAQTVGNGADGNQRGFARFASETSVTEFHGGKKDLSGDAVVMTYRSFNRLVKSNALEHDLFDLIICDEAHNALGEQVSRSLERYGEGKLVLGLTATPEYADNKKVSDLLPYEIHRMDLREAIEEGFLAPVQCLAIASDEEIEVISQHARDFTNEELEKLIEHEWRNQKAVEFAKSFVSQGKQGIIACVSGQNRAHAHVIAEKLQEEIITDPVTGELRPIKAIAIGSDVSKEERQLIYQAYERGDIDVISYVDLLTEGWDSVASKFIINLRPTASPVNAIQRMGRILRPAESGELAIIVEFIDKSEKPQYTFYHALGIDEIDLEKVYGRATGTGEGSPIDLGNLPDELRELLKDVNHRLVGELIVQPEVYELPEGVHSVSAFACEMGVGPKSIFNLMQDLGIDPNIYRFGPNNWIEGYGLTAEQQNIIRQHEFFRMPVADDTVKSIFAFCSETGLGRTAVKKAADMLHLELGIYRFGNNMAGFPALTAEQQGTVMEYLRSRAPEADSTTVSLSEFVRRNNTSRDMVQALADELGIEIATYVTKRGHLSPGLNPEQAERILSHPHYQVPVLTEAHTTFNDLKTEFSMERIKLAEIMDQVGVIPQYYRRRGTRVMAITPEDAQKLRDYVNEHMPPAPEDVESIRNFSRTHKLSRRMIDAIVAEQGVELKEYRFVGRKGAHLALGIDLVAAEMILQHVSVQRRTTAKIVDTREKVEAKSVYALAKELGISEPHIKAMLSEQGIETQNYIFHNTLGAGIPSEKVEALMRHPYFSIPRATEEDVTVNQVSNALGVEPKSLRMTMTELGIEGRFLKPNSPIAPTDHISLEQFEQLKQHPRFNVPRAEEGTKSIYALAREYGVSEKTVAKLAGELGLDERRYRFGKGKSVTFAEGLTQMQQEVLRTHPYFSIPQADENIKSVAVLSRELKSSQPTIAKIIESLDLECRQYKFGSGKVSLGFSPDEVNAIKAALEESRKSI